MSSILTNNGAMVALQTLTSINKNLGQIQSQISTGKSVATAKDNAAVWAISKVMESDVAGFKAIKDSLSLGQSTIAVASNAAETVNDLLTQMKSKIVASQEENVDRGKIQADIDELRNQIGTVTSAAQFNGLNLLSNTEKTAGTGSINVLSSLDRSSTGVTASDISVRKQDLGTGASAIATGTAALATADNLVGGFGDAAAAALTGAATAPTGTTTIGTNASTAIAAGTGFGIAISATATAVGATEGGAPNTTAADLNQIKYVARDGDTATDVAKGLANAFNDYVSETMGDNKGTIKAVANGNSLVFTGQEGVGNNFSVAVNAYGAAGTTIGGRLEDLAEVDVSSSAGAERALERVERMIQTSIDSAAAFGSAAKRVETQQSFITSLTDSLKSGIGSLVDANMEEASARLQALQVQQQLGVQSLSIANQAPQSILSLFR